MKTLWRIVKYGLIPLVLIIALAIIYISIGFNKLSFDDRFDTTSDYSQLFPNSYESARDSFRVIAGRLALAYENVQFKEIVVPCTFDDNLTLGVCYIPAQGDGQNLLILSSGVHGVEGYVGHAAQMLFINEFLNSNLLENMGVLLIHSINPYGFKYNRRVSENNVDLNRNSSLTDELYSRVNDGYPKVYNFINPSDKVNIKSFVNRFFILKAANEIRKASIPVLRQAILQGQYQFPEGLYFGGQRLEPQIDSLKAVIASITEPYQTIMAIDLHTGYGERGRLHFFPNPIEKERRLKLEAMYEGYEIDWGDTGDFYTTTGDFVDFIDAICAGKEFYPMSFEYGTLNSQTTLGSMKSLHIMILENQGNSYGYKSPKDSIRVVNDLLEMYNSKSESWRNYIMEQTQEVFEKVLPRFASNQD